MGNCIKKISRCKCFKKNIDSDNKIELSEMETNSPKKNIKIMESNIVLLADRLEDLIKIVKNLENKQTENEIQLYKSINTINNTNEEIKDEILCIKNQNNEYNLLVNRINKKMNGFQSEFENIVSNKIILLEEKINKLDSLIMEHMNQQWNIVDELETEENEITPSDKSNID